MTLLPIRFPNQHVTEDPQWEASCVILLPRRFPSSAREYAGRMKFTTDKVAALTRPPGKTDHIEWDTEVPGFGVRLRGETKRWVVQYQDRRQQRRESLGDTRKVRLDDARKIARQRFAQAELGTDPAAERKRAKDQAFASKLTLAAVAARYVSQKEAKLKDGTQRPTTYQQAKLHLTGPHWRPLANRPIGDLKRAEIAARLHEIVSEHGRTAAARARANLSALLNWAMREGLCESNPTIGTNDPNAGAKSRERVLADHELAVVWKACGDDDFGRIVRLLVLTGCRREEIGPAMARNRLCHRHHDHSRRADKKPSKLTTLVLPQMAMEILRLAPRRPDGTRRLSLAGVARRSALGLIRPSCSTTASAVARDAAPPLDVARSSAHDAYRFG